MPARLRTAVKWAGLIALTTLLVGLLELLRLPAALLIGSLAAAAALAFADSQPAVQPVLFVAAQGVVGCLVARSLRLSAVYELARDWPTFLGGVLSVVAASTGLSFLLVRFRVLPGSTAIWGAFPGAATVMTIMSEGFGADIRLVALMQYLRVVMVTLAAAVFASLWAAAPIGGQAPTVFFAPVAWGAFAATAAIALVSAAAGSAFRIPGGPLLVALAAAAAAQALGLMTVELPPALLAPAYCVVGWTIGSRFNRPILIHAAKVLPVLAASILTLIAACAAIAAALARLAHVDALTAYLATSPGGIDSVAIIGASTPVDLPFIMAMQMARLLVVLALGPAIARYVARRAGA